MGQHYGWRAPFIVLGLVGLVYSVVLLLVLPSREEPEDNIAVQARPGLMESARELFATRGYLTLLTGFWILYSTQLGIMDLLPRTVTDILWTSNAGVRRWAKGDVRRVYYSTLVVFVIWGCIAINLAQPFVLILLGAFVAGLMMSIYSVLVWYVNRKFLPKELQAPRWRQAALLLFSAFFGFFTIVVILQRVFGIKLG